MKINKLYTLSQFVDLVEPMIETSGLMLPREYYFDEICKYNEFLKQPLKREMFVNEIEKQKGVPPFNKGIDHHNWLKWEEAEKKVLFIDESGMFHLLGAKGINTLYELAEITKGTLVINEIEI